MEQRILAAGGDRRQTWLAGLLPALGRTDTFLVPDCPDTASSEPYDVLVLPCPCLDRTGRIRAGESGFSPEILRQWMKGDTRVFGGALGAVTETLRPHCRSVTDLLWDPFVAAENARLTAEAALPLAMRALETGPVGLRCGVLGYGRIGKCLAALLQAHGARVRVTARRPEVLAEAESQGFAACFPADYSCREEVLFNTVPAAVLRPDQLSGAKLWVELASAPGGLPETRPEGLQILPAGGLPGKYLPRSAAEVLYRGILRQLR